MIMMMIYFDTGRYRIFTHPNRSGGVVCLACPGNAGFILTDSLNATLGWMESHEARFHPPRPPEPTASTASIPRIPQPRRAGPPAGYPAARPAAAAAAAAATYNGREIEEYEPPPDYVEGRRIIAGHRSAVP